MSDQKRLTCRQNVFFGRPFCLLRLAAAQRIAHTFHSLPRLGELHVKAGYVSTPLAG